MTKIVCYDILPTIGPSFFGRQPTEYVNERMVVQVVGWQAQLGFDLKVGVSLDTNIFSTLFLYIQLYINELCPLDKARGAKVMQDGSRNVSKDL